MLYSDAKIKTIKENPSKSNVDSYSLMVRSSLIKKMGSSYYSFLPLGYKSLNNISLEIDDKLRENGVLEVFNGYGNETFLYSTVKDLINKYKDLPTSLFSTKEMTRINNVKSGYGLIFNSLTLKKKIETISKDIGQAREEFNKAALLLIDLFNELNINIQPIQTGIDKAEILAEFSFGDKEYLRCDMCNYASSSDNIIPHFRKAAISSEKAMEKVYTPNIKSIEGLSRFFKLPKEKFIKTLFFDADGRKILVIARGDRRVSEEKLKKVLSCDILEQEDKRFIEGMLSLPVGYIGPINLDYIFILADYSIKGMKDAITGANEENYHYKNVNIARDFNVDMVADLTDAMNGDFCPVCKSGRLIKKTGISLASLGIENFDSNIDFIDEKNKTKKAIISQYEIDINRVLASIIEQNRDKKGIIWPNKISPYKLLILLVKPNELNLNKALEIEAMLERNTVLIDDRNSSMGIKFNDSELLGFPYRIVISKKAIEENNYELTTRNNLETKKMSLEDIIELIDNNGR